MITELSFLIGLLLDHDLPKATKDLIAGRIKEVEQNLSPRPKAPDIPLHFNQVGPQQAPSTLANFAKAGLDVEIPIMPPVPVPVPIENVAQNQATANAMNYRNSLIADQLSGKATNKMRGALRPPPK